MFHSVCPTFGSDRLQMVSNLHRMFRPCTMTSSSWWVSSVGQSTTSSTDHLDSAIYPAWYGLSTASPSLLIAALHARPNSPILVSSMYNNYAVNPLQPTSTGNSQVHHPLSLQSTMRSEYLRVFPYVPPHNFLPVARSCSSVAIRVVDYWDTI